MCASLRITDSRKVRMKYLAYLDLLAMGSVDRASLLARLSSGSEQRVTSQCLISMLSVPMYLSVSDYQE